jgi:triphosphoribosyl-dephospho-CoA synthase
MAPKPGNVTRYQDFHDTTCEDFLISAWAAAPVFAEADKLAVGDLILKARRASSQYVKSNTNLGIILLFAPLAKAALDPTPGPLRRRLHNVLKTLTVDDCQKAYTAIRETQPGGIGKLDKHDVRDEPAITLLEAMDIAKDRDSVALEYSSDYRITFALGYPALLKAREESRCWTDAVVQAFLTVLAEVPDTLIARKLGREKAKEVSIMAKETLDAGMPGTEDWKKAQANLDSYLREDHNHLNPGTTADLITASLFVLFIEKGYEEFLSEGVAAWQE